jgi:arabinogalactan endo-1,4-beta-galactosidase
MLGIFAAGFFQSLEKTGAAEPFILGADTSWIQQQEDEGRKFSVGGTNADFYAILRDHGFNWIRLRLFNEPKNPRGYSGKGYCDLPHTLEVAKRVKAAGFKLLLDFHYSDTWADPSHQNRPLAWRDLDDAALAKALGDYTRDSLRAFEAAGVLPGMVQIGNEISNGFLWREGETNHIRNWDALCNELKSGIAAVREVAPKAKVMIHLDTGGSNGKTRWFFDNVLKRDVKFDVIGLSYYPKWHGTVDQLNTNLTDLATRYAQPVIVVEYSVPTIREVNEIVHGLPDGKGLGTFIWEPTGWPHGDHPALFEKSGAAKPELEIYCKLAREFGIAVPVRK